MTIVCNLACPGMRQGAPISALIKPIGLCGTQKAPKKFRTGPKFLTPPYRAEVPNLVAPCRIPGHASMHV